MKFLHNALVLLTILAILAYYGRPAIGKFDGQWRCYLRRPYHLLAVLLMAGLWELVLKFFQ